MLLIINKGEKIVSFCYRHDSPKFLVIEMDFSLPVELLELEVNYGLDLLDEDSIQSVLDESIFHEIQILKEDDWYDDVAIQLWIEFYLNLLRDIKSQIHFNSTYTLYRKLKTGLILVKQNSLRELC